MSSAASSAAHLAASAGHSSRASSVFFSQTRIPPERHLDVVVHGARRLKFGPQLLLPRWRRDPLVALAGCQLRDRWYQFVVGEVGQLVLVVTPNPDVNQVIEVFLTDGRRPALEGDHLHGLRSEA